MAYLVTFHWGWLLGSLLLGLAAGCQDVLTYSDQTREAGMTAYMQGDYPKAAGAFRSALRQDPRDYRSHYYLGMSELQ